MPPSSASAPTQAPPMTANGRQGNLLGQPQEAQYLAVDAERNRLLDDCVTIDPRQIPQPVLQIDTLRSVRNTLTPEKAGRGAVPRQGSPVLDPKLVVAECLARPPPPDAILFGND